MPPPSDAACLETTPRGYGGIRKKERKKFNDRRVKDETVRESVKLADEVSTKRKMRAVYCLTASR